MSVLPVGWLYCHLGWGIGGRNSMMFITLNINLLKSELLLPKSYKETTYLKDILQSHRTMSIFFLLSDYLSFSLSNSLSSPLETCFKLV